MLPVHFTVTQVRVAASCPRILYFDSEWTERKNLSTPKVTRIWKEGDAETTACGTLFHQAVEKFNQIARTSSEVNTIVRQGNGEVDIEEKLRIFINHQCVKLDKLASKPIPLRQAFIRALEIYVRELAGIIHYAKTLDLDSEEIMRNLFGDIRKRVDVTFHVGPNREPVHVTGSLDYVFFDWRTESHRILDYKLTPSHQPMNDLFQVCTYALMHHHQHQTKPDVAVLYLHPQRAMHEMRWDEVYEKRHEVYDLLASMAEWVRYNEKTEYGFKPIGNTEFCPTCRWNKGNECERRLGAKDTGTRFHGWTETPLSSKEPAVDVMPVAENEEVSEATPTVTNASPELPLPKEEIRGESESSAQSEEADIDDGAAGQLCIGEAQGQIVTLNPNVLNTHVAVVGAAGSGKTWMAKCIAEEAVRNGIPGLIIDPQGDLVQFLNQHDPESVDPRWRSLARDFCDKVETRVFTPGTSHAIRLSLSPVRLSGSRDLEHLSDPERRQDEETAILKNVANNLVNLASIGGEATSQENFLFQILKQLPRQIKHELNLNDIVSALHAPDSIGIDDPDLYIKKAERAKLARKLIAFLSGPSASLFEGGVPLDMETLTTPVQPGKVPLNVIYLNAMVSDEEKQFLVAAVAAELYRWMVTSVPVNDNPNLLFYLDEAKDYIPAGASKPPAKEPLKRLFAQGRKYGISCLLCTQSPQSVDYNIFSNCSTKIIGRLESAQDVERVREWFSTGGAPGWLADRKGAEKGTFIARWPDMPPELEGETLRSRVLFSQHQGAWSPEQVEHAMMENPLRLQLSGHNAVAK